MFMPHKDHTILLQADLKRLWRKWFPCCKICPCLQVSVSAETSIIVRDYYSQSQKRRRSSSEHQNNTIHMSEQTKKLLSVKMNGHGCCETKLTSPNGSRAHSTSSAAHTPPSINKSQTTML